ncbi:hypothetical protein ACET3Z_022935 [Daucus carota]
MADAEKLFDEFTQKDVVSWNSMISGYVRNADAFKSLRLLCRMFSEHGLPDQHPIAENTSWTANMGDIIGKHSGTRKYTKHSIK